MRLPRRAVSWLVTINVAIYLFELGYAYGFDFSVPRLNWLIETFGFSNEGLFSGQIWQLVTHLFLHSLDSPFHIVFNMLVLYWFGRELEQRWGTRRFLVRYGLFGLGGALAAVIAGFIDDTPMVGASGATSGLVACFCIYYWKTPLRLFVLELTGRGWLIVFIVLDVVRLLGGDPVAVEAHWGGMLTAAIILRRDVFNPRLLWLRFKRWRLKRRLRLREGGNGDEGSNGDQRYLH